MIAERAYPLGQGISATFSARATPPGEMWELRAWQ